MRTPISAAARRRRSTLTLVLAAALLAGVVLAAQRPGVHPVSGRVFAPTMGFQGAPWLERPEREEEENPDRALRFLQIPKGAIVADIGAGSGYFTIRLAKIVGPTGRVYAGDIQQEMLDLLGRNATKAKLRNIVPVLGTDSDPRLPADSLDLIIMVDVYHEFSQPQAMLRRMRDALRPTGRLVLLEYRAEDPFVPIRPEHKMTRAQVRLEVEHEGYVLATESTSLPRQHLLVFKKTAT